MEDKRMAEARHRSQIPTTTYFTWRKEAREAIKAHFKNGKKNLRTAFVFSAVPAGLSILLKGSSG